MTWSTSRKSHGLLTEPDLHATLLILHVMRASCSSRVLWGVVVVVCKQSHSCCVGCWRAADFFCCLIFPLESVRRYWKARAGEQRSRLQQFASWRLSDPHAPGLVLCFGEICRNRTCRPGAWLDAGAAVPLSDDRFWMEPPLSAATASAYAPRTVPARLPPIPGPARRASASVRRID